MSDNILSIILILLIIGIIVYFYYNYKDKKIDQKVTKINSPSKQPKNKKLHKKRVRFNISPKLKSDSIDVNSIDVDSICYSNDSGSHSNSSEAKICPSNLDNQDSIWDAQFGLPLVDEKSKKKSVDKMKREHEKYGKSLGKFHSYQMDKNTLIKTDTTIDPFKPQNRHLLAGKSIKDIYDNQVSGPKAKPKKILGRSTSSVIYENESEMNGGNINGSSLHGYDTNVDGFKMAEFDNEF